MLYSKAFTALVVAVGILGAHATPIAARNNLGQMYKPTPPPGQRKPPTNAAEKGVVAPKPTHLPGHFQILDPAHQKTQMTNKDEIIKWLQILDKKNLLKVDFPSMGYGQKELTTWALMTPTEPRSVCDIYGVKLFPRPAAIQKGGPDAGQRCQYSAKLTCGREDVFTTKISEISLDECGTHQDQEPTAHRIIEVLLKHANYLRPNQVWHL